jgi:prepilin-type N-terminal cleavage/methylation domain-containing protein
MGLLCNRRGFTLLETIIAIAIILFGLLSVIALSTSSLIASNITSDEFLATNFAREGIEAVRAVRDTNWLAYDTDSTTAWDAGLSDSGPDYTSVVALGSQPVTGDYLEFDPDVLGDTCSGAGSTTYDCTAIWYDSTDDLYIQVTGSAFDPASYEQTGFSRLVYTYPLCRNDADETDETVVTSGSCSAGYTQVGVDAIVTVQWPGRNAETATYTLEEYLYDWKY